MLLFYICLLIKLLASAESDSFIDNIHWKIANKINLINESPVETCLRYNLFPYYKPHIYIPWNESIFNYVVTEVLKSSIINTNNKGILGCCASGLWCYDNNTCFTQGYTSNVFSNYGWLPSNNLAKPIYACMEAYQDNSKNVLTISKLLVQSTELNIIGQNFDYTEHTSSAYIYGESCEDLEICNCMYCRYLEYESACPLGTACLTYQLNYNSYRSYCFHLCANEEDESCPCGYVCTNIASYDQISACLPSNPLDHINTCNTYSSSVKTHSSLIYQSKYTNTDFSIGLTMKDRAIKTTLPRSNNLFHCKSDSDCNDNNICTIDACNSNSGTCAYADIEYCDSMSIDIRQQKSPFTYHNYYQSSNNVLQIQQKAVLDLLKYGSVSKVSEVDDQPDELINLPFSILYFGTIVKTLYVSPNGRLILPPYLACSVQACNVYRSQSNIIAPYSKDWDPKRSKDSKVITYKQTLHDNSSLFGINTNAFHILYNQILSYDTSSSDQNTFSVSIYSDSSIRFSYIDVSTMKHPLDFFGLWGSFASDDSQRYHQYKNENISHDLILTGSEVVYCPMNITACPIETCLTYKDNLELYWNGTTTCKAFGEDFQYKLVCSWNGNTILTNATLHTNNRYQVSCPVPNLDSNIAHPLSNNNFVMIQVDLLLLREDDFYQVDFDINPISKAIYVNNIGTGNELVRSSILIRYYSSVKHLNSTTSSMKSNCGCNALPKYSGLICDSMSVCGGINDQSYLDCAGTPFGSAIKIDCASCSGGYTGIDPDYSCTSDSNEKLSNIVTETIILLMIILCLSFITLSVAYTIRRITSMRVLNDPLQSQIDLIFGISTNRDGTTNNNTTTAMNRHFNRGLNDTECESIGSIIFTKTFYIDYLKNKEKDDNIQSKIIIDNKSNHSNNAADDITILNCECSICLMDIEEGSECRVLPEPCGHLFHITCIDQWLHQSSVCPLCKRSMREVITEFDDMNNNLDDNTIENNQIATNNYFTNGNNMRYIRFSNNDNNNHDLINFIRLSNLNNQTNINPGNRLYITNTQNTTNNLRNIDDYRSQIYIITPINNNSRSAYNRVNSNNEDQEDNQVFNV